jgi:hypothetical protein
VPHCDAEALSLFALGEPIPPEIAGHLDSCALCGDELASLRHVVHTARDETPIPRIAPPPHVWARIAAVSGVEVAARPEHVLKHSHAVLRPVTLEAVVDAPDSTENTAEPAPDVVHLPSRPRPSAGSFHVPDRAGMMIAAACLVFGLVAGGLGTWVITGRDQPAAATPGSPNSKVLAATRLAGLPLAPGAVGRADVVSTASGRRLDLDVQQLAVPQGFYEVWLIDPTVTKMVPIGVLSGDRGEFSLPDGVDLSRYPLLDISIQPLNGDPKHSGRSVLRGTFAS